MTLNEVRDVATGSRPWPDPLHQPGSPTTAWTTVNTGENFPGVATPLGWTFWCDPLELGMRGAFCDLGVLTSDEVHSRNAPEHRCSSAIYGRFVANVDQLRAMADLIPGTSGAALEEQLLGSAREDAPGQPSLRRAPVVAVKMPAAAVGLRGRLARDRRDIEVWWRQVTSPGACDGEAARSVLAQASEWFARTIRPHTIATMLATATYDRVKELAHNAGLPQLQNTLISDVDVEEAACAADLWEVARGGGSLDAFLSRHGYHGPNEAEVSSRVWREDRSSIEHLLEVYAQLDEDASPAARKRRTTAERQGAERSLHAALGPVGRVAAAAAIRAAKRFSPLREVGKASYLHAIDGGRAAVRALGQDLERRHVLENSDDVRFLTVGELLDRPERVGYEVIEERRRRFELYQSYELPDFWIGVPEPGRPAKVVGNTAEVSGIPASPGSIEGTAKVLRDTSGDDIEAGDILVCPTTDPSWASFFVAAAALVIDIGGPMSHGAIIARELGIPCVINTGDGTRRIRTGDRLQVDGDNGVVHILATASTN